MLLMKSSSLPFTDMVLLLLALNVTQALSNTSICHDKYGGAEVKLSRGESDVPSSCTKWYPQKQSCFHGTGTPKHYDWLKMSFYTSTSKKVLQSRNPIAQGYKVAPRSHSGGRPGRLGRARLRNKCKWKRQKLTRQLQHQHSLDDNDPEFLRYCPLTVNLFFCSHGATHDRTTLHSVIERNRQASGLLQTGSEEEALTLFVKCVA
jgi:hypothetical protein